MNKKTKPFSFKDNLILIPIIICILFLIYILCIWAIDAEKDWNNFKKMQRTSEQVDGYIYKIKHQPRRGTPRYFVYFFFKFADSVYTTHSFDSKDVKYSHEFLLQCRDNQEIPDTTSPHPLWIDKDNPNTVFLYNPLGLNFWGWYKNSPHSTILPIAIGIFILVLILKYGTYAWKRTEVQVRGKKKVKDEK